MIKNITFITSYFAPAWGYGGPPRVLYTLAKELISVGKSVKVITSDVMDERRNKIFRENLDGIDVYRFKTISNTLAYKTKLFFVPGILDGARTIIDNSDIVLFSDLRSLFNWQLYPYVERKKIPYGIFAFGEIPHGTGLKAIVKSLFDNLWGKKFVQKATYRFCQTRHEQRMFMDYFDIPITDTQLLPLSVELNKQKVNSDLLDSYKKKWDIKNNDRIILFVGRLHFLKGIDLLIQAVVPLFRDDPRLKLLIVGRDDGEESNLRSLVGKELGNRIVFTGPLYEDDVVCAYNLASCFVTTPRFYEETSLASLEALSYGVPVVVTRQADIPYLEKYQAGYVVNNNSDSINKAVVQILEKLKKDGGQVKANSQKLITDKFSASIVARKLLSIIDKNYYE